MTHRFNLKYVYVLVFDHPDCDLEIGIFATPEGARKKALGIVKGFVKLYGEKFDPKKYSWEYRKPQWRIVGDEYCEGIAIQLMRIRE